MKSIIACILCWIIPIKNLRKKIRKWGRKRSSYFMSYGKNNQIVYKLENGKQIVNPRFVPDVRIEFSGCNNKIYLTEPYNLKGSHFILGNNCEFDLNQVSGEVFVQADRGARLKVGKQTTINDAKIFMTNEHNTSVEIGEDCMFSFDISIWASDTHKIVSKKTNETLNLKKFGIKIGNHVWLGARSIILKDVEIADNCVVGAGSVVCKKFGEQNCVLAGNPAKIVKNDVDWRREAVDD